MERVHVVTIARADLSKISGRGRFILEYGVVPVLKVFANFDDAAKFATDQIAAVTEADGYSEYAPRSVIENDNATGEKLGLVNSVTVYPKSYLGGFLRVGHSVELVWRDAPKFGPGESERMRARAGGG